MRTQNGADDHDRQLPARRGEVDLDLAILARVDVLRDLGRMARGIVPGYGMEHQIKKASSSAVAKVRLSNRKPAPYLVGLTVLLLISVCPPPSPPENVNPGFPIVNGPRLNFGPGVIPSVRKGPAPGLCG